MGIGPNPHKYFYLNEIKNNNLIIFIILDNIIKYYIFN